MTFDRVNRPQMDISGQFQKHFMDVTDSCRKNKPVTSIIKQVTSYKSSLLLKIDFQNTQTLQLNEIGIYLQK